jgi:hypothetical protein
MFVGFCLASFERMYPRMTAAVIDRCIARPPNGSNRRITMPKSRTLRRSLGAAIALAMFSAAALAAAPANATVVYCKTAGVPQGCVVRTRPVVVTPVVRPVAPAATAVRVTRVGYVGAPVSVRHVGYTRVTPYGVRHIGYTRVRR